jgi:AmiR/NasT family two-component response regulator
MFNPLSGRILSICPFQPVLSERGTILEQQGYEVVSCEDPATAQPLAMRERFNLVIVGHGFDVRDIREMICWIRNRMKTPVLLVHEGPQPRIAVDAFLPCIHLPEQLIRVVGWLAWR